MYKISFILLSTYRTLREFMAQYDFLYKFHTILYYTKIYTNSARSGNTIGEQGYFHMITQKSHLIPIPRSRWTESERALPVIIHAVGLFTTPRMLESSGRDLPVSWRIRLFWYVSVQCNRRLEFKGNLTLAYLVSRFAIYHNKCPYSIWTYVEIDN